MCTNCDAYEVITILQAAVKDEFVSGKIRGHFWKAKITVSCQCYANYLPKSVKSSVDFRQGGNESWFLCLHLHKHINRYDMKINVKKIYIKKSIYFS